LNARPLWILVVSLSGSLVLASAHARPAFSSASDVPLGVPSWLAQTLLPEHTNSIDEFGSAVAIEGSVAMVGSPLYPQDQGGNGGQGLVYVYTYANGAWTETQQLAPANLTPGAGFGSAIEIHGTTAVISAPTQNVDVYTLQGAVYVYTLVDGQWQQAQELTKTNGGPYDSYFGESIAFDGDTIVIGETAAGPNTGEPLGGGAYVFTLVAGQWTETASLYAADAESLDAFGRAVAVSGDEILVASPEAHWDSNGPGPGSVHRFQRSGDTWTETQLLQSENPVAGEYFGEVVDMDGALAAFGAPGATVDVFMFAGATYVFGLEGDSWQQQQYIDAPEASDVAAFGRAVSIKGSRLAIGGAGVTVNDVPYAGAAYLYDVDGTELARFASADPQPGDYFGYSVDLQRDGSQVISGVPHAIDDGTGNPGSALIFTSDEYIFASDFDGP
jgi:hypothetical protein